MTIPNVIARDLDAASEDSYFRETVKRLTRSPAGSTKEALSESSSKSGVFNERCRLHR